MHVYSYRPASNKSSVNPIKHRRKLKAILVLLLFLIIFTGLYLAVIYRRNSHYDPAFDQSGELPSIYKEALKHEQAKSKPLPNVQSIVDTFVEQNAGEYSVVVTDLATETELANHQPDESYFAASIYKLYVAYLGYMDIQVGKHKLEDPFLGEFDRKECLDKMIRESHSPCAEKLWMEQGKQTSTTRLKKFDLSGTSMEGLTTTAHDVNIILDRLANHKELNETHTNLFLESMKNNIYRDVIPKALPNLAVYDKVGFRELVEYHDAGIITLPSGRQVAITLLTRSAGTQRLVTLTKKIFAPLMVTE